MAMAGRQFPTGLALEGDAFEEGTSTAAADEPPPPPVPAIVDVLVIFDNWALANYGSVAAAQVDLAASVNNSNTAQTNSGAMIQYNLVGNEYVNFTPSSTSFSTLLGQLRSEPDGIMDFAHDLRNERGADLVAYVTDVTGACGIGYVPSTLPDPNSQHLGFTVTDADCANGNKTLSHEMGHNTGNGHDVGASQPGPGIFSYSQGYVDPPNSFRTIMSYTTACAGCLRINLFSGTAATYLGNPTGSAGIDNSRSMTETGPGIASYRTTACPAPTGDEVAGAVDTTGFRVTVTGTNTCARRQINELFVTTVSPVQSTWVRWVAPYTGTATFSTCNPGTDFDTYVTIFDEPFSRHRGRWFQRQPHLRLGDRPHDVHVVGHAR